MSEELVIHTVELLGDGEDWRWEFRLGVNVVVGPVGVGKTTLLNLIRFGLGGDWQPTKKAKEAAHAVRLRMRVGGVQVVVRREFGKREVCVTRGEEPERLLPLKASKKRPETVSTLLLELLALPRVRVPRSRARPGRHSAAITFGDVMSYLYLEQTEIDRATARSDDKVLGVKRLYIFELLYGLLDEEQAARMVREGERADERQRLAYDRSLLESFAARYREAVAEILSPELLAQDEQQTVGLLADIERDTGVLERRKQTLEEQLETVQARRVEVALQREATERELFQVDAVLAQLELDVERMGRAVEATAVFQAFDYVTCPRCLQALELEHPAHHCALCGQEDVQRPSEAAIRDAIDRRAEQRAESARLRDELVAEVRRLEQEDAGASERQEELERDLAAVVRELTGRIAKRAELNGRQAALAQRRSVAALLMEPQGLAPSLVERVEDLDAEEAEDLRSESAEGVEAMLKRHEHREEVLNDLSAIFREILVLFDLPWFEGLAAIDESTYLPIVDGQTLNELSSGGMKATVNLAYYLSNLVFSLRDRSSHMPRFLMIDGLRKDFGAGEQDLARADSIYRFLLTQQRTMTGPVAATFQMLVVDNDLPAGYSSQFNVLELDYQSPLISDPA